MIDTMLRDGLTDAFNDFHMGIPAERLLHSMIFLVKFKMLLLCNLNNVVVAAEAGRFKEEIVPVIIPQRKGEPIVFDTDEFPRKDASLEGLAKLRSVFKEGGTVTAGNASGINDGAAAVVVMSSEKQKN